MNNWTSNVGAWTFPSTTTTYDATAEISDGRFIYMLKPYYFNVTTGAAGTLTLSTTANFPYNGYSTANAAFIKAHSVKQFVVVGCGRATDMDAICGNPTNSTSVINQLVAFCHTTGFTGVNLDFENFGVNPAHANYCSPTQYSNFLSFVAALSTALHNNGFQLMIDGPQITTSYHSDYFSQSFYIFNYADVVSYCDYVEMQIYDFQYNGTAGTSLSPNAMTVAMCQFLLNVAGATKAIAGMPAYGYKGPPGSYTIFETNYNTFQTYSQVGTATRNADYELNWTYGGIYYDYMDTSGMNSKRALIEAQGIQNTHVWYIGGNKWFTGTEPSNPSYSFSNTTNIQSVTNLRSITF